MKRFKPGDAIADSYIQKRYRDKQSGSVLLKLKTDNQFFYKLTDSGAFHYTIDKFAYPESDLELIHEVAEENLPEPKPVKKEPIAAYLKPYLKKAFYLKDNEGIHIYDDKYYPIGSISGSGLVQRKEQQQLLLQKNVADYEIDEVFPESYRDRCTTSGEGYSFKTGNVLLLMNKNYLITDKMTLSSIIPDEDITLVSAEKVNIPAPPVTGDQTIIAPIPDSEITARMSKPDAKTPSPPEIVNTITDKFKQLIKQYGMMADYFIHEKLEAKNRKVLLKVFRGKLGELNDETKKGIKNHQGQDFKGSLSLLKAALIHELYINSTLAGRNYGESEGSETGKNMKNLINSTILLNEYGEIRTSTGKLAKDKQKKLIMFFGKLGQKYNQKKKIILRIYQKMLFDFDKGNFSRDNQPISFEWFKAQIIYKIYENTNRMERDDGITMICLSRDIMDIKEK